MKEIVVRFKLVDAYDVPIYVVCPVEKIDINLFTKQLNSRLVATDLWTGFKDKNDRLIFNGDTIKHKFRRIWKTEEHVSKVEWDQKWGCFYLNDDTTKHRMRDDAIYEIVNDYTPLQQIYTLKN